MDKSCKRYLQSGPIGKLPRCSRITADHHQEGETCPSVPTHLLMMVMGGTMARRSPASMIQLSWPQVGHARDRPSWEQFSLASTR
jgi:hypothetical protein